MNPNTPKTILDFFRRSGTNDSGTSQESNVEEDSPQTKRKYVRIRKYNPDFLKYGLVGKNRTKIYPNRNVLFVETFYQMNV